MSSENNNSSSGSKKKKVVASAIAVALAAALMIGGTFSYFSGSTDTIINLFSANTNGVTITENTGNEYEIVPGTSQEKDPTVTATATLDSYVYLVVEDNTDGLVEYEIDTDVWTLLYAADDEDNLTGGTVYYAVLSMTETETDEDGTETTVEYSVREVSYNVLKNQTVSYSASLTNEDMWDATTTTSTDDEGNETSTITYSLKEGITLSFTAYIIQQASFNSAEEAYPYAIGTSVAVDSEDELKAALADTDVTYIVVTSDITLTVNASDGTSGELTTYLTVTSDTTLDLGDYTLSFDTSGLSEEELDGSLAGTPVLITVSSGTLTIESGTFDCSIGDNGAYAINVNGGSLVINGGTFYGAPSAVQVQSGSATINGGTFDFTDGCKDSSSFSTYLVNYLLNCLDSAYTTGTASITVYGGTYVSFNPASNGAEGDNTTFVANGYTVTSSTNDNNETVYTVSASSSDDDSSSTEESSDE